MSTLIDAANIYNGNLFNESLNNSFSSYNMIDKMNDNKTNEFNNFNKFNKLLDIDQNFILKMNNTFKLKHHFYKINKISEMYIRGSEYISIRNGYCTHQPMFLRGWGDIDSETKLKNMVIKSIYGSYFRNMSIKIPCLMLANLYEPAYDINIFINDIPKNEKENLTNIVKLIKDRSEYIFNYFEELYSRKDDNNITNIISNLEEKIGEVIDFWNIIIDSMLVCETMVSQAIINYGFDYSRTENNNDIDINFNINKYLLYILKKYCQDTGLLINTFACYKYRTDIKNVTCDINELIEQENKNNDCNYKPKSRNNIILFDEVENHSVLFKYNIKQSTKDSDHIYDKNGAQIIDRITVDNHKIIVTINSDGTNSVNIEHNNNVQNSIKTLTINNKHCRFGWKAGMTFCGMPCIIKLYIPQSAKLVRCSDKTVPGKYRTDKLEVLAIYPLVFDHENRNINILEMIDSATSLVNPTNTIIYKINTPIYESQLDLNQNKDCAPGLHFHFSIHEALQWFEEMLIYHNMTKDGKSLLGKQPKIDDNILQNIYKFDRVGIILHLAHKLPLELVNIIKNYLFEF